MPKQFSSFKYEVQKSKQMRKFPKSLLASALNKSLLRMYWKRGLELSRNDLEIIINLITINLKVLMA